MMPSSQSPICFHPSPFAPCCWHSIEVSPIIINRASSIRSILVLNLNCCCCCCCLTHPTTLHSLYPHERPRIMMNNSSTKDDTRTHTQIINTTMWQTFCVLWHIFRCVLAVTGMGRRRGVFVYNWMLRRFPNPWAQFKRINPTAAAAAAQQQQLAVIIII